MDNSHFSIPESTHTLPLKITRSAKSSTPRFVKLQELEYLNFEELKVLSENPDPKGYLSDKLENFWQTPIIDNTAYYNGHRPQIKVNQPLGSFISVATWNIEKSLQMDGVLNALQSENLFIASINEKKAPEGSKRRRKMLLQRNRLASSNIILLQEMDIGVNRSGYINAAEELAQSLKMNYAYGVQALEIDPVILGTETAKNSKKISSSEISKLYRADPSKYKGVFGSAVLSDFPIKNVEVFQLKIKAYDWYHEEKKKSTFLELARRKGSKLAFHNTITREMKVGGRNYFRVDLEVPGLPHNTLTVINVHLEIKCRPKVRVQQMEEILSYIKDIPNPVIMAGDYNSAPSDISPTSIQRSLQRALTNKSNLFSLGTRAVGGALVMANDVRTAINTVKNFHSPLAPNIPVLSPNPVRPLIDVVRKFEFTDGGTFDFRGDRYRSINGSRAILANSNHKSYKGQVSSFTVKRPIAILGYHKLDWIFMKPYSHEGTQDNPSYKLSPHYAETLVEFSKYVTTPLSDHRPCVIDLPLEEPNLLD